MYGFYDVIVSEIVPSWGRGGVFRAHLQDIRQGQQQQPRLQGTADGMAS